MTAATYTVTCDLYANGHCLIHRIVGFHVEILKHVHAHVDTHVYTYMPKHMCMHIPTHMPTDMPKYMSKHMGIDISKHASIPAVTIAGPTSHHHRCSCARHECGRYPAVLVAATQTRSLLGHLLVFSIYMRAVFIGARYL